MTNTRARRHYAETVKGFLPPAQELIALVVALHFETNVLTKRLIITEFIHCDGVVDDQINRRQRVYLFDIPAEAFYRLAHRGQIHHGRYTRKILHQYARRTISNFAVGMTGFLPFDQFL
ncbi:hypothetical protein SRABI106_04814 [Rahnella aquatilis]|nr:hypothetical protein SRABI106_04814 [Rahnella aquatilis]